MLAGIERPVRGDLVDRDQGPVDHTYASVRCIGYTDHTTDWRLRDGQRTLTVDGKIRVADRAGQGQGNDSGDPTRCGGPGHARCSVTSSRVVGGRRARNSTRGRTITCSWTGSPAGGGTWRTPLAASSASARLSPAGPAITPWWMSL